MKKLLILFALLTVFGCSEDDDKNDAPQEQDPNAIIADNAVVILAENSEVVSSDSELSSGIYKIQFNQDVPDIETNDIIIGDEGLGFLRRVTSVSATNNVLTMQTTQANMEDVFGNTSFSFSSDLSQNRNPNLQSNRTVNYERFKNGVSRQGFTINLADTNLFSSSGVSFDITEGAIDFDPNFNFEFDYSFFSLNSLKINTQNTMLNANARFTLSANATAAIPLDESILYESSVTDVIPVSGIPVVVTKFLKIKVKFILSVGGTTSISKRFQSLNTFNLGANYENDTWQTSSNLTFDFISHPVEMDNYLTITESVIFVPEVVIAFYGVNGPIIEPELTGVFGLNAATSSDNWDAFFNIKSEIKFGASVGIFGETLETLPLASLELFEEPVWNAPDTVEIVSGNGQTANQGEPLDEPLKVKVFDNSGLFFLKEVPVYFEVVSGNGTLDSDVVLTDEEGIAEVNWTLGNNTDEQQVTARLKKANGALIESTVTFNASVTEVDLQLSGDLAYGEVPVGETAQRSFTITNPTTNAVDVTSITLPDAFTADWTSGQIPAEGQQEVNVSFEPTEAQSYGGNVIVFSSVDPDGVSLPVSGTGSSNDEDTFTDPRDGQVYPLVTIGNQVWFAKNLNYDAAGSWCYDDNAGNCNTYGRLYNWQTALTACPPGTHLPSDAEWTQLTDYLGGTSVAGGKMKSTTGWNAPNTGATNSSGFTGLPGGKRNTSGDYGHVGNDGYWWSATASSASNAWYRDLNYNNANVYRYDYNKTDGLSCRCLRD